MYLWHRRFLVLRHGLSGPSSHRGDKSGFYPTNKKWALVVVHDIRLQGLFSLRSHLKSSVLWTGMNGVRICLIIFWASLYSLGKKDLCSFLKQGLTSFTLPWWRPYLQTEFIFAFAKQFTKIAAIKNLNWGYIKFFFWILWTKKLTREFESGGLKVGLTT